MTRPNRNELCPCGSGKKHKKCCGAAQQPTAASRGVLLALAPVALLAGLGIYAALSGSSTPEAAASAPATAAPATAAPAGAAAASNPNPATPQQPAPQPGAAPPGKVWSPEHGHWHDAQQGAAPSPIKIDMNTGNAAVQADGSGIRIDGKALAAAAQEMRLPGQPEGPPPPGKVWSTEHKHWHDRPTAPPPTVHMGTLNRPSAPVPQPGPAPAGTVWSPEHGHWHKAGATPAAPPPTTTQP